MAIQLPNQTVVLLNSMAGTYLGDTVDQVLEFMVKDWVHRNAAGLPRRVQVQQPAPPSPTPVLPPIHHDEPVLKVPEKRRKR